MLLAKDLQVYIKTTDTCNLNCEHCFTSGSNGGNIYFSPINTIHFLNNLIQKNGIESLHLLYHGGEPMLAPLKDLEDFYQRALDLPVKNISFGIQTNLVYQLTKEKIDFLNSTFKSGIGTSWDSNIRFGSLSKKSEDHQKLLWEKNVKILSKGGHEISLMVCLSRHFIENISPEWIIEYAINLGIKYIQFERITSDGNAFVSTGIHPKNIDVDSWFLKMYRATIKNKYYEKIQNMFLNELVTATLKRSHIGNRCRNCEQHIITINADGSMAGCPNSATQTKWGNIESNIETFLTSPKRIQAISKEKERHEICLSCPVNHLCNGDCYKLKWDKLICPAPKSLLTELDQNKNTKELERFLI